jgi:2-octaprenyl-6-methoxyphenol hydroxylase
MPAQSANFDLIIVGGGLAGNTLAFALRNSGLKIALVESMTRDEQFQSALGDRALALSAGTVDTLASLGLWQGVADKGTAIQGIHVSDRGHFGKTRLSARKEKVNALGYVITARDIESHIAEMVDGTPIRQFRPARVIAMTAGDHQAEITIAHDNNPQTLSASLLVGADGGNSAVRGLAGIGQKISDYDQTALVSTLKTSLPHHNIAFERFTETGPLALLPLGSYRSALIWTRRHADASNLLNASDDQFINALQDCFGYRLGALTLAAPRRAFPVSLVRAEKMIAVRSVLIGNAAHQLHPVAGQGFNLGMRDVIQLAANLLEQSSAGNDIGAADFLQAYARRRQADHDRTIQFTDSLVRLFSSQSTMLALARNTGMTLLDHSSFGKSLLSRHAMGLAQKITQEPRDTLT